MASSASLRDLGAAGHAGPGGVDAVEDVLRRRLAGQERERVGARARRLRRRRRSCRSPGSCASPGCARRSSPNGSPETGSLPPISIRSEPAAATAAAAESAAVLEDPLRLPGGQLAELLGERLRVAGELERLDGQDGRRRVVAVAARPGERTG